MTNSQPDEIRETGQSAVLETGPDQATWRLILAHGAGAPMDSPYMTKMADLLSDHGIAVTRFEFPYMAARRVDQKKRPPDRAPKLLHAWIQAIRAVTTRHPTNRIAIGGKSMGGRMATLLAAETDCPNSVAALVTLGYPFHPPGKPDRLRTDHFPEIDLPVLMVQGSRDPFGTRQDVAGYTLPKAATLYWAEDGDHDLKPRKISGRNHDQALNEAADQISRFLKNIS